MKKAKSVIKVTVRKLGQEASPSFGNSGSGGKSRGDCKSAPKCRNAKP